LVWFTLAKGIFTEIFYPHPDLPCTRDFGLVVTADDQFFSEEKCHTSHEIAFVEDGIPAYHLTNTCRKGRYRIEKTIFTHPRYHAVIQHTRFVPLKGKIHDYRLYTLLAPHLGGKGADNTGWRGNCKGQPMLFARRAEFSLALGSSASLVKSSVGFVGSSDGWQDLHRNFQLTEVYDRATNGNIALTGELDVAACDGEFTLVLGFGSTPEQAGHYVRASLQEDPTENLEEYVDRWREYQKPLLKLESAKGLSPRWYRTSTAVMCAHEGKSLPGTVASLSIPWGMETGDDNRLRGGYHLVWPRDLVETAGGLLAAGAADDALRRLAYLRATQEADGHWPQNMWLSGAPFWTPIQLCETGLPILLANLLKSEGVDANKLAAYWPMVRAAAMFICEKGPETDEDRWERESGYTPFTLAVIIAALLVTAESATEHGDAQLAAKFAETADDWNSRIEGWLYVTDTDLCRRLDVEGYYARILKRELVGDAQPHQPHIRLRKSVSELNGIPATEVVSVDALALVRFGLRAPDDPRILNTLKVIDATLKTETPIGSVWHRFTADDYGESKDGSPFPGHAKGGFGRGWPLLTGERAHYELAAGNYKEAQRLMHVLEGFASETGMLPEQVWDAPDIPKRDLFFGRATGSAMPLVWAHAEYVKLVRSLRDERVFDMPSQTVDRYLKGKPTPSESRREQNAKTSKKKAARGGKR
jgi:glucoamylase